MNNTTLKEKISWLTHLVGLIDIYQSKVKNLEKKENKMVVCDLDATLFSRDEQLQSEQILRENRWDAGNTVMINNLWIDYMLENYYKNKKYPQEIISKLDPSRDIIITVGIPEYQYAKLEWMKLRHFNTIVVSQAPEKILETIRYIIYTLQYIPSEIIVYEDRPEYFIEYREFIQEILWTKLTIMKVEMDGNEGYKNISEV